VNAASHVALRGFRPEAMYLRDPLRFRRNHPLIFPKVLCANPCISVLRLPPRVVRHIVKSVAQHMAPCHLDGWMPREGSVREGKGADTAIALHNFVRVVPKLCGSCLHTQCQSKGGSQRTPTNRKMTISLLPSHPEFKSFKQIFHS
jgi:hypothetical protein